MSGLLRSLNKTHREVATGWNLAQKGGGVVIGTRAIVLKWRQSRQEKEYGKECRGGRE
jgi:fatty acid/phospholipid biosynthesis enzyme